MERAKLPGQMLPGQELCGARAAFPITASRGTNASLLPSDGLALLFSPSPSLRTRTDPLLGSVERAGYFPASRAVAAAHPAFVQLFGGPDDVIAAGLDALPVHADGEGLRTTQRPVDHLGKRGQ